MPAANCTRDAEADDQLRLDGSARETDLLLGVKDVLLDERARAGDHAAERVGKCLCHLAVLLTLRASADGDDDIRLGDIHILWLLGLEEHVDRALQLRRGNLHFHDLTVRLGSRLRLGEDLVARRAELRAAVG